MVTSLVHGHIVMQPVLIMFVKLVRSVFHWIRVNIFVCSLDPILRNLKVWRIGYVVLELPVFLE